MPIEILNRLRAKIASLVGTPQKQVNWKNPDEWVGQRLEGELRDLAEKTWAESSHRVNPRYVSNPWRVINKYQLLTTNRGILQLTDAGRSFLEDPTGATVQNIDESESIFIVLLLVQRGDAAYGELLKPWTTYSIRETTSQARSVIRSFLSNRLRNILDRGLFAKIGNRYSLTEEGKNYIDQSEHGIDEKFINGLINTTNVPRTDDDASLEIVAYLEEVLPDAPVRRQVLEIMATSIEQAHEVSTSSWSLSFSPATRFRLNVGRIVAIDVGPKIGQSNVSLYDPDLSATVESDEELYAFASLKGAVCKIYLAEDLVANWADLQEKHLEVVRRAAAAVRRTPYYPYHTSTAVTYINETVAAELPDPEHGRALLTEDRINRLVKLMQNSYPGWDSFRYKAFEVDEVQYKHAAVKKAQRLLSEERLRELVAAKDYETFIKSLDEVGHATNLLYVSTPSTGDLSILFEETLDHEEFCENMVELLYGEGDSADRLTHFVAWVERRGHYNRWTFPTYFLFLCHPESELFVKPMATLEFLKLLGTKSGFTKKPTASTYVLLRNLAHLLLERLEEYEPRDMIDIQSMIWVCHRAVKKLGVTGDTVLDKAVLDKAVNAEPGDAVPDPEPVVIHPVYPLEQFSKEAGIEQPLLERWVRAIERKKQAIFYGPPGTGKTFVAEKLAQHLVGGGRGAKELIQFHPAYAYEDFIQGLRPVEGVDGAMPQFRLQPGRFLDFCRRAEQGDDISVLILDEINRANLSRVFGELMYLLEYRDKEVPLAGGGRLQIPENVRIIGTMNTADRSIALVDHALRRRFAFVPLRPDYEVLRRFHRGNESVADRLIGVLKSLNSRIGDSHYEVGISFFLCQELLTELEDIWRMEIEPYIEEYFVDQPGTLEEFRWERIGESLKP